MNLILESMKTLREGADDTALAFAAKRSAEMVCAYCGMTQVPKELAGVCVQIGLALYDSMQEGGLRQIQEGNVSVSFTEASTVGTELMKEYAEELNRFRCMQW